MRIWRYRNANRNANRNAPRNQPSEKSFQMRFIDLNSDDEIELLFLVGIA
jgi:hypothetical protein